MEYKPWVLPFEAEGRRQKAGGNKRTIKRLLKKYGYPPDKCEKATSTVLEQAELLCTDWVD